MNESVVFLFPKLFNTSTFISVEYPSGWHYIIEDACRQLDSIRENHCPNLRVVQIKEKFGSLRMYAEYHTCNASDSIERIITFSEKATKTICESCGSKGKIGKFGWLIRTLCENCEKNMTKLSSRIL